MKTVSVVVDVWPMYSDSQGVPCDFHVPKRAVASTKWSRHYDDGATLYAFACDRCAEKAHALDVERAAFWRAHESL